MFKILSSHNFKTFSKTIKKNKYSTSFNLNTNFLFTHKNFSQKINNSFNDGDPTKKSEDFFESHFKIDSPPENMQAVK